MFDWLRKVWIGWYFDKDGAGAGGNPDDGAEDEPGKEKSEPDKSEAGDDKKKAEEEKVYSKAEMEAIVEDRLKRDRKKSEAAAEKARKEAEEAALTKNQEWQQLAEKRGRDLETLTAEKTELEPFKEQAERYKKALNDQLVKAKEKLPKHILQLIDKMDPVDAMTYITENAEALGAKLDGFQPYSETPEGKEKKVSSDDEKAGRQASAGVITRSF